MKYKKLLTKDDREFISHAKRVLQSEFAAVMMEAKEAFEKHIRPSEGKRQANLVILNALRVTNDHHWRAAKEVKKESNKREVVREVAPMAVPPARQNRKKWNGPSIIDMADQNKKESLTAFGG